MSCPVPAILQPLVGPSTFAYYIPVHTETPLPHGMPKCRSCQRAHHGDKYVIHASVSNVRHVTSGLRGATGAVYFHDGTHINWHDASITKDVAGSRRAVALFRTWLAAMMHD